MTGVEFVGGLHGHHAPPPVAAGLKESGVSPSSVVGIAVAGQQHGLVVLDRSGRPLRPALLWN
ncbi:FGGY family carbohydrate kinase, partial [Nocardia salmonicida]|uniref:FGGY family carbohydrate kinase n=1 Tax=Nocardia salmonicida TaxID=53431 RepID=UPI00365347CB